ncbi:hypothetical protein HYALB_00003995 [Hymenoscyphus albidus]|uniref:Myb-like domain-containing protein n=1 Tax=Hymenoscyphus albidus TaxID=595503 RepID=A0A9N9Q5E4_9HELO|nr:hypothetical protein HYALB_00003995 [Hymenoscyphus albidus]
MLKGRNKKFAPKVGGARRPTATPASTQSSARPSVEPQSESLTLMPSIERDDSPPLPDQEPIAVESEKAKSVVDITNSETSQNVKKENATKPRATTLASPKRKAQDDIPSEPPVKKISLPTSARNEESMAHSARSQQTVLGDSMEVDPPAADRISLPPQADLDSTSREATGNVIATTNPDNGNALAPRTFTNPVIEAQPEAPRIDNESDAQNYATPTNTNIQDTDMEGNDVGNSRATSPDDPRSPPPMEYPTPPGTNATSASPAPGLNAVGVAVSGNGAAGTSMKDAESGEMGQRSSASPAASLDGDELGAEVTADPSASGKGKAKKRKTTKKRKTRAQEGDEATTTADTPTDKPRRSKKPRRKRADGEKRDRRRAATPDDAEDEIVDFNAMKVSDLCRDLRIGKKFSRHDAIKQRYEESKIKARLARDNLEVEQPAEETQAQQEVDPDADEDEDDDTALPPPPGGIRQVVVNGQIVVDQSSTQHDAQAAAREQREAVEVVEEDDYSRLITSNSFAKKMKTQKWDELSTELFYQGLAQFGTDFEMIAKMFPKRERKSIKLKFNKEERTNPVRVTSVLRGEKKEIDLDWFQEKSNIKLEDVEILNNEREEVEKEHQKMQADFLKEQAESNAAKAREIMGEDNDAEESAANKDGGAANSGKGRSGKGGKKDNAARKKKNIHSSNTEETFEVIESIEKD